MTDRSNYQRVGVEVDEQSFGQLTQRVNDVTAQTQRLNQANMSVAESAQKAGDKLKIAFSSLSSQVDTNIQSVQELRSQLTGAATDASNLGKKVNDGGGGEIGIAGARRTGAFLNRIGLPEIGQPLQIIGGLQSVDKTLASLGTSTEALIDKGGIATETIQQLGGSLGVVTVAGGLAVAALAAIVVAGAAFKSELDEASKGLSDAVTQVDDYYKAIAKGTTDSISAQIKADELQKKIDQDKVNALQAAYDAAHPKLTGNDSAASAALTAIFSDLSDGGKQLNKDLEISKKALNDNVIEIKALKQALGDGSLAANDAAEAEKVLQSARDKSADKNIQIAQQTAQLEASGTTKGVQDRIAQIEAERKAISDSIATGELSAQKTDELRQRTRDLAAEEERLTVVIGPVIKAREDETEALKKLNTEVQQAQKLRDEQAQKEVDIVKKYNGAVQSAEDTAATARLNANQKLQDAFVAAAQNAVDAANKALETLEQKRDGNLLSQTRDQDKITRDAADQQLNDQIKAQRQERDDLQSHLDNLKQIRDRDAGRQRDDLLNRNYRDLFALNEQKNQDMGTENDRYSRTEQQRQQTLQNEEQDQLRAIQVQRRERLISYQQANQDAVKQYNIELQNAEQAKSKAIQAAWNANVKELALTRQSLIDKEALLRQGAINELKLTSQTSQARQKIFQDELNQARAMLGQTSIAGSAPFNSPQQISRDKGFAEGGFPVPGQITTVNEKRRESFKGVPFPPGLGLFIPMQSGYINPEGSGGPISVTIPISINGVQDPAAIGRQIDQHMEQKVPAQIKQILGIT